MAARWGRPPERGGELTLDEAAQQVLWNLPPECSAVLLGGPACKASQSDPLIHAYFAVPVGTRSRLSQAFDEVFYLAGAGDVRGEDSFAHFLVHASDGGVDPHPLVSLKHLRREAGQTPVLERLADLMSDQLHGSTHPLLDPDYVLNQAGGERLSLAQMLELFGTRQESLTLAPHPLFQPAYYRQANAVQGCNEFLHYLQAGRGALHTHPLVSPLFVAAGLPRRLDPGETLLEVFLQSWPDAPVDPSLFVDLRHLNHRRAQKGDSALSALVHPLAAALARPDELETDRLHAQCDPRVIAFSLGGEPADALQRLEARLAALTTPEPCTAASGDPAPVISVVMPTFHKSCYTALSIMAAETALSCLPHEIIVVENGGDVLHHEELRRLFSPRLSVRFVKFSENRFFGEASNIGADLARGTHVLFLNNDCFLAPDFGERLQELLASAAPRPEALGVALLFPDGALQELGGMVGDDGQVIQLGKRLPAGFLDAQPAVRPADYVSAACLLLSRRALDRVVGFDPVFEPFYFEDVDLCRRLALAGIPLYVGARLRAMHVENASTRDFLGAAMNPLITRNRETFARRWMTEGGRDALVRLDPQPAIAVQDRPMALVATPFDITPGGGERYLLSAARALSKTHNVVLACSHPLSHARVEFTRHALGIEAFPFDLLRIEELRRDGARFDVSFVMGNEIVPFLPPLARRNLFHLQFPFPWRHVRDFAFDRLGGFDAVVVNSCFTAGWTTTRLAEAAVRDAPPVVVLAPPVAPVAHGGPRAPGPLRVANLGRFFTGGHCKRQDVVLDVIEGLRAAGVDATATLVGSVAAAPGAQAYFDTVAARAHTLGGVELIRDASRGCVEAVLQRAHVYLHPCGFGVDGELYPEALEHYGIAVAEAISAGCHPVVVDQGGPREILASQGVGDTFSTIGGAVDAIAAWAARKAGGDPPGWRGPLLNAAFDEWMEHFAGADKLTGRYPHIL